MQIDIDSRCFQQNHGPFMFKKIIFALIAFQLTVLGDVKAFFNEQCEDALVETIGQAKKEIHVAIYTFTRFTVARAFLSAAKNGVDVQIIFDKGQATQEHSIKIIEILKQGGVKVSFIDKGDKGFMHHKFCIVDQQLVATGSYNYTTGALKMNDENLIIIKDEKTCASFLAEWERLKKLSEQ
jgi:phosphatidylserine/phosphatidylglycerophosphate/cardiolipin synthase-like enzyme